MSFAVRVVIEWRLLADAVCKINSIEEMRSLSRNLWMLAIFAGMPLFGQTSAQVSPAPRHAESDVPPNVSAGQPASSTASLLLDFEEGMLPVLDQSNSGHQVKVGGAPKYVTPGAAGNYGLKFDGELDFLEIDSPVIGDSDEFSFEMWVSVEDFQEDQVPDGNWQFWAIKPESCPECWNEATFSILTGAFEAHDQTIRSRYWVEEEDGTRRNVELPLETVLSENEWYQVLVENRTAPIGDVFDYYALMQLRAVNGEVIETKYVGYNGRPLNNPDIPLRLGLAAGRQTDDGAGFQGVIDEVKYYNYSKEDISVLASPSIGETGFELAVSSTGQLLITLTAQVTAGLGSEVTSVSAHVGDGVTFDELEFRADTDAWFSGSFMPELGRVVYVYFTAVNADGLITTLPANATEDIPRYFEIPLYSESQQLVLLDFENELVQDQSDVGHYVNAIGEPKFSPGAVGNRALELDGVDDYVEVLGSFLGSSDEFSLEIRFNVDDFREGTPEGSWMYLINKPIACDFCWDEEAFSLLWGMNENHERKLAARFWNPTFDNAYVEIELSTSMETGQWYHALLEVRQSQTGGDPYEAILELRDADGVVIDQGHASMPLQPALASPSLWPIFIGHIGNRSFLDGHIDHFAFYGYPALGLTLTSSDEIEELPETYILSQNYPNPFNPVTTIQFQLPEPTHVTLDVFNLWGQRVATLLDDKQPAGQQQVRFNAGHLSSGMYMYRIRAGSFTATKHMMLVK